MQMLIDFKQLDPPTGTVQTKDRQAQSFVGWMGLIHTLEELVGSPVKE